MPGAGNPAIAVPASRVVPSSAAWQMAAPLATVFALALIVPFVGNDYWVLIASRAATYWVLVAGLNLIVANKEKFKNATVSASRHSGDDE